MVTITHLYNERSMDLDNLPKPILDALKGLVFSDDSNVTDLICRKRRYGVELDVPDPTSLLSSTYERFREFVHVNVENVERLEAAA